MPEHIKAFVVVSFLSGVAIFVLMRWKPLPIEARELKSWTIYWFLLIAIAFLSPNYWIFIFVGAAACLASPFKGTENKIAAYLLLLPALPMLNYEIPGFGGIRFFFAMSFPRLLVFTLLIPAMIAIWNRGNKGRVVRRRYPSDKFAFTYFVLVAVLGFRDVSMTAGLRGVFDVIADLLIPYYVISRGIDSLEGIRRAFSAVVASGVIVSLWGIFEAAWRWFLFSALELALTSVYRQGLYHSARFGSIRVQTTFAGPIPFGYYLVIVLAALTALKNSFRQTPQFFALAAVIVIPLIFTFSRGPWVGFVVFLSIYALLSPQRGKAIPGLSIAGVIIFIALLIIPGGEKYLSFLPYVGGGVLAGTIDYREQLWTNAIQVIQRQLWFGSTTYLNTPEMLELMTGQHIIDIVNSYLRIALDSGIVGLALFAGTFLTVLHSVFKATRRIRAVDRELFRYGQVIIAAIVAMLVIIATTSSIGLVSAYYWAFAALGAAYFNIVNAAVAESRQTAQVPDRIAERQNSARLHAK